MSCLVASERKYLLNITWKRKTFLKNSNKIYVSFKSCKRKVSNLIKVCSQRERSFNFQIGFKNKKYVESQLEAVKKAPMSIYIYVCAPSPTPTVKNRRSGWSRNGFFQFCKFHLITITSPIWTVYYCFTLLLVSEALQVLVLQLADESHMIRQAPWLHL